MAGTLRGVYNGVAEFDATLKSGGEVVEKFPGEMPRAGGNHVGVSVAPGGEVCGICEGSRMSRILNRIPGVNGTAGFHDALMAKVDLVLTPNSVGWHAVSIGTMAPSAGVTSGSLIGVPAWQGGAQ